MKEHIQYTYIIWSMINKESNNQTQSIIIVGCRWPWHSFYNRTKFWRWKRRLRAVWIRLSVKKKACLRVHWSLVHQKYMTEPSTWERQNLFGAFSSFIHDLMHVALHKCMVNWTENPTFLRRTQNSGQKWREKKSCRYCKKCLFSIWNIQEFFLDSCGPYSYIFQK